LGAPIGANTRKNRLPTKVGHPLQYSMYVTRFAKLIAITERPFMKIDDVVPRIEYSAPQHVRDVISSLGRTEDVRFSPNNRRLGVAGFLNNKVVIFDISVTNSGNSKNITLTNAHEISSGHIKLPHGLDFIDDEKIIVTNRGGLPCVFDLSSDALGTEMEPLA